MERMPTIPRRVVTGHDERGVSVFVSDGPVPVVRTAPDGAYFYEIWSTDAMPAPDRRDRARPDAERADRAAVAERHQDPDQRVPARRRLPGAPHPVGGLRDRAVRRGRARARRQRDGAAGRGRRRCSGAPATAGRTGRADTARMAFILVDGAFTAELLDTLGHDVLGGLLHDPIKHAAAGLRGERDGLRTRRADDRRHRRRARPGGGGGGDPGARGRAGHRRRHPRRRGQGPRRAADGGRAGDDGVPAPRRVAARSSGPTSPRTWKRTAACCTAWSTTRASPTAPACTTWTWRTGTGSSAINLTGTMLGMRTLAPLMPDNDGASIVNIGSIAGLTAHFALAYTVSKWGLRGLTKVAALELAPRGIRVNIVHPGPIDTPILDGAEPGVHPGQRRADADRPGRAGRGGRRRGGVPAVRPRVLPQRRGDPGRRRAHLARRRQVHHRRARPGAQAQAAQ